MSKSYQNDEQDRSEINGPNSYISGSIVQQNIDKNIEEDKKKLQSYEPIVKSKAFLPLNVIIYFDSLYSFFYLICVSLLFLYKGLVLPYPPNSIGPEVVAFYFFMIIQFIRLKIISIGSKIKSSKYITYSLLLAIPVIMGYTYLLYFQTYSLVFDLGLNIFSLIYIFLEIIFALFN